MNKTPIITAQEYRIMTSKTSGPKRSKYKSVKTAVDGITFDSKKESQRWGVLLLLEKRGEITELERQPEYDLSFNGVLICKYKGDFSYKLKGTNRITVEDVKSDYTRKLPVYRIKKKLMLACYNIEIKET